MTYKWLRYLTFWTFEEEEEKQVIEVSKSLIQKLKTDHTFCCKCYGNWASRGNLACSGNGVCSGNWALEEQDLMCGCVKQDNWSMIF